MPFAYSIVPIAPSQTRTRRFELFENRSLVHNADVSSQPSALSSNSSVFGVDQQIRRDTRSRPTERTPCALLLGEPVMVAEQVQSRLHGRRAPR